MDGIVPKLRTLDDTEWVLTSLRGQPLLPGTTINLSFEEVTFSGSAGCNRYGGEYAATDDGSLSRPMLEVTVMGCTEPEGVMEQEQAYIAAFASIATYQLSEDRLELQDASRETILVYARQAECMEEPANLAGTAWQLVSVDGQEPMEGSDTTLAFFDDKWLAESSKCEAYVSAYQTSGHELRLVFEAWLGWTCQDEEGQGTTTLGSPTQTCLVQGRLQITTLRGQVFTYEPLSEAARPALEGSTWSLLSIVEERWIEGEAVPVPDPNTVLEGTEITLTLEGGAAGGSAGCNDYGAVYTLDGASLALGDVVATERGCSTPEGVMEQEERYLVALKDVTGYRMVGSQLWLLAGDRRALVFSVKA
jgi:heat shock protein HslJ